ncbi:MAG: VOC family protein [Candidatus Micrarchaeia archaeon]
MATCLWFDHNAEQAAKFYTSIFKGSKILSVSRYGDSGAEVSGMEKGSVLTVSFRLNGQEFMALNGGPVFKFSPAVSFVVKCKGQKEIDYFWKKLSSGGKVVECGWLTDKFGVSWQVVPASLDKLTGGRDAKRAERVMSALLKMKKLDIKKLEAAYKGK